MPWLRVTLVAWPEPLWSSSIMPGKPCTVQVWPEVLVSRMLIDSWPAPCEPATIETAGDRSTVWHRGGPPADVVPELGLLPAVLPPLATLTLPADGLLAGPP